MRNDEEIDYFLFILEKINMEIKDNCVLTYDNQCFYKGYGSAFKEHGLISEREWIVVERLIDLSGSR